jgi:hypothetical protein
MAPTHVVRPFTPRERRRAERIEVLGHLHGCLVAANMPITVREASATGFSIETPAPFPEESVHSFRFSNGEGKSAVVRARSMRCLRVNPPDRDPFYIAAFAFETDDPESLYTMGEVLRALTSLAH